MSPAAHFSAIWGKQTKESFSLTGIIFVKCFDVSAFSSTRNPKHFLRKFLTSSSHHFLEKLHIQKMEIPMYMEKEFRKV